MNLVYETPIREKRMKTLISITLFFAFQFNYAYGTCASPAEQIEWDPTLYLIPDTNHQSGYSEELRNYLEFYSLQRKIVYGSEGLFADRAYEQKIIKTRHSTENTGFLFGIEDVNALFSSQIYILYEFNSSSLNIPLLVDAIKRMTQTLWLEVQNQNSLHELIRTFGDQIASKHVKFLAEKLLGSDKNDPYLISGEMKNRELWKRFYLEMFLYLKIIKFIKDTDGRAIDLPPLDSYENQLFVHDELAIHLRNKHIVKNILTDLSPIALENKLPIYVFVGASHVEGVKQGLEKAGCKVERLEVKDAFAHIIAN